jgi:hypothetical protein
LFITRIIRAPRPGTISLLLRRMGQEARKELQDKRIDAIGLVQTDLPSLFYMADIGLKAGNVVAVELHGNCPQHFNTVAFFGDTAAVAAAMSAVKAEKKEEKN